MSPHQNYIVGLDNGGTANKFTVMNRAGDFLVDALIELPSRVTEGPQAALDALDATFDAALEHAGIDRSEVLGVGFDTPGPATATGVISSKGGTNFAHEAWRSFDFRTALETKLGLPVVYSNDANAAALYAHHEHFGAVAVERSSISAIVGTGLGGGVMESGRIVKGAAGMVGLIAAALFALLGVAWTLSSPLMGAPDEPAQTVKAVALTRTAAAAPTRRKRRSSEKYRRMWWTTRNQSVCVAALMTALNRLIRTATESPRGASRTDQARARTTKSGFPGGWGMPMMWPVAMYSLVSQKAVVQESVRA